MGQITITAGGSMSPDPKGKELTIVVEHGDKSNDQVFAAVHAAVDQLKTKLREKIGDAGW